MEQFTTRLKKGDEVIVIAGKAKGKSGRIARIVSKTGRVVIEGINLAKKHVTARAAMAAQKEPGIVEKALPLAISNVMLKDPKTGKPTRVSYKLENGAKVRVATASGTVLDNASKAKTAKAEKPTAKKTTKAKSKE